jgi:hypothetical protein
MKRTSQKAAIAELADEPMGIVISRGPSVEEAPTFAAYIWSAEPEAAEPAATAQAA